jgi:hypothetical protein
MSKGAPEWQVQELAGAKCIATDDPRLRDQSSSPKVGHYPAGEITITEAKTEKARRRAGLGPTSLKRDGRTRRVGTFDGRSVAWALREISLSPLSVTLCLPGLPFKGEGGAR